MIVRLLFYFSLVVTSLVIFPVMYWASQTNLALPRAQFEQLINPHDIDDWLGASFVALLAVVASLVLLWISRPRWWRLWLAMLLVPFVVIHIHRHLLTEKMPPLDFSGIERWAAMRCGAVPQRFRDEYHFESHGLDDRMAELRQNGWRPYRTGPCPHERQLPDDEDEAK